jgi:hypothetical protein
MRDSNQAGLETTIHVALAVAAISAAVASFFGLRGAMSGAGVAEGILIPVVVSFAVGIVTWTLWHQLLLLARRPMASHLRVLLLGLGLSLALAVAAMSAWWIAASVGGQAALTHHQQQHLQALQKALDEAHAQRMREQELVPVLRRAAASLRMEADNERDGQGQSGKAGDGPVARAAAGAASDFDALATRAQDAVEQAGSLHRGAMDRLEAVQRRIAELGPMAVQPEVVGVTGQIAKTVAELQNGHMAPAVEQTGVVIGEGGSSVSRPNVRHSGA